MSINCKYNTKQISNIMIYYLIVVTWWILLCEVCHYTIKVLIK